MATMPEVEQALRNADAAGRKDDAKALAQELMRMRSEPQAQTPSQGAASLGPAMKFESDAPEAPPVSRSDYLWNSAKRGFGSTLEFGSQAAELLTGAQRRRELLGIDAPMQSQVLREAYQGATNTDPNMQAPDELTRYAGKGLEFAVAGAPFSGLTVARAAQKVPATLAELYSSIGGGAGFTLGGDIGKAVGGDTGQAVGEFSGGVGGGLAALATPVAVSKLMALLSANLSKEGREAVVQQLAGARLAGPLAANPESQANMLNAQQVAQALQQKGAGTFQPTIGGATGAEGVISMEGGIARKSPEDVGRYAQRATENRAVIESAKDIDFPAGGDFRRGADTVVRRTIKQLDARSAQIDAEIEQTAQRVAGTGKQEVGERLQDLRDAQQKVARASRDARMQDVYATADRLGIKEDMADAVALVKKVTGDDPNTYQNMPPVFKKVLAEHAPKEPTGRSIPPDLMAAAGMEAKPASFQTVHSLWKETNSQAAAAGRAGDATTAHYLGQLKDVLKAKLVKYEQEGQGELSDKFRAFNEWYSSKYAPAFKEGVGGRMAATSRYGEVVKPEQVVGKFFTPSGIDDFNLIFQGDKNAQTALKDGILGLFSDAAIKGDKVIPSQAANFIKKNAETLDKVPDIKAMLTNATERTEALGERAARLSEKAKEFDKSAIARIANSDNPGAIVQEALSDRQKLLSLISAAKTPGDKQSVLRTIADNIPDAAAKAKMDPLEFITKNEASLKPALNRLGPQHYDNLKLLANAETIMGRTDVPTQSVSGQMKTFIEEKTGSTPRTIWAQSANTAAGRQSPVSGILHLLSRYGIKFAEEKSDEVLRAVIYDPALAAKLVAGANRPVNLGQSNSIMEHFKNAGIRVGLEMNNREQQSGN